MIWILLLNPVKSKLSVRGLRVYYTTSERIIKAVDGVSFEIKENESLGIAGESACGKSTLGSALLRNLQPAAKIIDGSILLDDVDILKLGDSDFSRKIRWKRIAMVFQGAMNALDPVFTVKDQMKEILKNHNIKESDEDLISKSLADVGLEPTVAKKYPHELSGGMKQRIVIAMALLLSPDILIADEPTTALDVLVQTQIIALLRRLKNKKGITIILISHDLAIMSALAEKIAIMYSGQIVEFGNASDIYMNPKHPYTQALISAMPRLNSEKDEVSYIAGHPPDLSNLPSGCKFLSRCPYAMEVCKKDPPQTQTNNGYTYCWLYE
jgi:peptide/nickel transport system ATP-binding protein